MQTLTIKKIRQKKPIRIPTEPVEVADLSGSITLKRMSERTEAPIKLRPGSGSVKMRDRRDEGTWVL